MLPEPFERLETDPCVGFEHSIIQELADIKRTMRHVSGAVRTLCRLIVKTNIKRCESQISREFEQMIKRLGGDRSHRFNKLDRTWIANARAKLEVDMEREKIRVESVLALSSMSTVENYYRYGDGSVHCHC